MPERKTLERVRRARREGKSPSTQAGEFVREEIEHIRDGKHGARSAKQVIAIGLSKARRAGVRLKTPAKGRASAATRRSAARDSAVGKTARRSAPSKRRSRAALEKLRAEPRSAASHLALSRQARAAAARSKRQR